MGRHHHQVEMTKEMIMAQVKRVGYIGRHRLKTSNNSINKKLKALVKEGLLVVAEKNVRYAYYCEPGKIPEFFK